MNIKKIITFTLSVLLLISTFTGCRKVGDDGMSSGNTSDISSTVYGVVDVVENESSDLQSTDSQASDTQSTVTSNENSSISDDIFTENIVSVGDGGNSGNNSNVDPEPPKTFIDPEAEQDGKPTYMTSPDANNSVITVDIAAGKSVFYKIRGASNRIFTINSPNAYVIFADKRYDAENGKVSFFVETNQLPSAQIIFEIGNKGTQTESFTIVFTDLQGTWDNKESVDSLDKKITTTIDEGDEDGYWYQYTATEKGKIRFYLLSGTDAGVLLATAYRNDVAKSSGSTDEDNDIVTDSTGTYIVLNVNKGDIIFINIGTKANETCNYPAAQIEWMAKYE